MILYDVWYPHSRSYDRSVPWSYLARMESAENNGCIAIAVNGDRQTLHLINGHWITVKETSR